MEVIPLTRPWFDEAERGLLLQALAGRVAGDGPFGRRVEQRLAERTGARRALLTTSCTHALELALLALGVGPGDEVIVPSFTFVSTANAVLRVGAQPVLADIEPVTLGLDPRDAEQRLSSRTRALLPMHYAGLAADLDGLLELAGRRRLLLVEDAAQGFGGRLRGRALGTFGDAGCLSFHETKNVTCGEGGALLVNDAGLAARAEIIREKGTNRGAFLRGEVDKYTWVAEGSSYVLSDLLAALLEAQLEKADRIAERRAAVAARYRAELASWAAEHGVALPAEPPDQEPGHHIFHLLFPSPSSRDAALAELRAAGIGASFHYLPLHLSPFGRDLPGAHDPLPVSERVAATLLRLPLHPLLTADEVSRVVEAVTTLRP